MKTYRGFIVASFIGFVSVALPLTIMGAAVATPVFSDIQGHTYQMAIEFIQQQQLTSGYPDGTFRPDAHINRAELLTMVTTQQYADLIPQNCFGDVQELAWYSKFVCKAHAVGIVAGYPNGLFKAGREASFVEALIILERAHHIAIDPSLGKYWFEDSVKKASEMNIIPLDVTGFDAKITRGQVAEMITRLMKYEQHQLDAYLGSKKDFRVTFETIGKHENEQARWYTCALHHEGCPQAATAESQANPANSSQNNPSNTSPALVPLPTPPSSLSIALAAPTKFKKISLGPDLRTIWNIDTATTPRKDEVCAASDAVFQKQNFDQTQYQKITITHEGVGITFLIPVNVALPSASLQAAEVLTKAWITTIQNYFGTYPCKTLTVVAFQNQSDGMPGFIDIGGDDSFNYYWILWHELTHSYFGNYSARALWLRQGPTEAIPTLILGDNKTTVSWSDPGFAFGAPNFDTQTVENEFKDFSNPNGYSYSDFKVYFEKNACQLREPESDAQRKENSNWGRMFIFDLVRQFGKQPVVNALRAVYEKYRYSNLTPTTDKDFYDAFIYYINDQSAATVNAAQQFAKTKLCM